MGLRYGVELAIGLEGMVLQVQAFHACLVFFVTTLPGSADDGLILEWFTVAVCDFGIAGVWGLTGSDTLHWGDSTPHR